MKANSIQTRLARAKKHMTLFYAGEPLFPMSEIDFSEILDVPESHNKEFTNFFLSSFRERYENACYKAESLGLTYPYFMPNKRREDGSYEYYAARGFYIRQPFLQELADMYRDANKRKAVLLAWSRISAFSIAKSASGRRRFEKETAAIMREVFNALAIGDEADAVNKIVRLTPGHAKVQPVTEARKVTQSTLFKVDDLVNEQSELEVSDEEINDEFFMNIIKKRA